MGSLKSQMDKLRTSLFIILIVQKISETYTKPVIGRGVERRPLQFPYWGNPPPNLHRMDRNPFLESGEVRRNYVSSEESDDFDEESNEYHQKNRRHRGDDYDVIYDPKIEKASYPELKYMYNDLTNGEALVSPVSAPFIFSFKPVFSNFLKKIYCFMFNSNSYCDPDNLFLNDPWYDGFRSKKD